MQPLFSIIMPCYNASAFIAESIESVINQTYKNWELLIINDCSTDDSFDIISKYIKIDNRIKYYETEKKSGGAIIPRNIGIANSNGDYIAFLDSDDYWHPSKIEKQLVLFSEKEAPLVFSDYEKVNSEGKKMQRVIKSPKYISYDKLLSGNVIGCLTAIYSVKKVGKVYFRDFNHEDYVLWLEILKKGGIAHNVGEVLAYHRTGLSSLSSNKFKAMTWTWNIYRKVEHLSVLRSSILFCQYAIKSFLKYIK